MFKKPQVVSEQGAARRGGKLSGIGTKMERIFRTTFRKEQSQSREQLHPAIEDQHDEELKVRTVQKPRQRLKNTPETRGSVVETDLGSRVSLVAVKSPSKSPHIVEFPEETDEQVPQAVNTRKIRRLERLEHVESQDFESHSVDVIADVHGEVSPKIPEEIVETVLDISSEELDIEQEILEPSLNEKPLVDSTKMRQRKRWSKDTNIVLPPKRNSQSSSSASDRSSRWVNETKPIPVPRLNKIVDIEENRGLGLDNEAYEPEDQILRVETDQTDRKPTVIEIKPIKHESSNSPTTLEPSDSAKPGKIRKFVKKTRKNVSDNSPDRSTGHESSSLMSVKSKKSSVSSRKSVHTASESSSSTLNSQRTSRAPAEPHSIKKTTKKSKLERKRRSASSNLESATSDDRRAEKTSVQRAKRKKSKIPHNETEEIKFISVKIHKADMLVPDYITRHPMVIVHLIEELTGDYLKHPNETKTKPRYLQPLITGIYDFYEHKTTTPNWDEELIFEYNFHAISNTENQQIIIFFEIVDLPSFADASNTYDELGGGNCWYRIAWAFLKPLNRKGISHLDKTVRLQLYRPKRSLRKSMRPRCEPYSWWKSKSREKYPSTLYVTVASVDPPKLEPVFYGQLTLEPLQDESKLVEHGCTSKDVGNLPRWSRLAAQSCKIPNELLFKTSTTDNGCFYTVFSNSGQYMACANCEEYDYPITIYKIDEGKVSVVFSGHKSFIYALDWSSTDEMLLSVSSDQTARLWDVENKIVQEIHMLPHPSYVYCGKFEPSSWQIVVTGCYDRVARLWSQNKTTSEYELVQELEAHDGYVNAICYLRDGDFLTGDSLGVIIQWTIKKRGRLPRDWQISRKIKIREIVNVPINTISLHPLGSRLLVHSRDSGLRMLDLATGVVLQRYLGLKNLRIQSTARISPCGGMIMCGGEDATLSMWSVESGKLLAKYQAGSLNAAVTCVDYHPYDHVLAYSVFGAPSETLVLKFDKHASGESVGLKLLTEQADDRGVRKSVASSYSSRQRDVRTRADSAVLGVNNDREDLQSRLRMFNSSEGLLKMRSTNRLTSIIAKIDRILSNSGSAQKSYDVEANRLETSPTMTPYVPPLFETFEMKSSESRSSEVFEMSELYGGTGTKHGRSKSAQHRKSSEKYCDDEKTPVSDDIITTRKARDSLDVCETSRGSQWATVPVETAESAGNYREEREESARSGGTYVVDEKNDGKLKSGSSSTRSDVTFVIENEKPVPKPRKKHLNKY